MMKKLTTLLLALVLSLSTFLGLTTATNVHADEAGESLAKEAIELKREELPAYSDILTMRQSNLSHNGGFYFNALSFFNGNATKDGNVYLGAYMGLADGENYFDFTKYASMELEVHGITNNATWLSALLIDADGDCVRIKTNIQFNGTRASGEKLENYTDGASDWHGTFIGNRHGTLTYTPSSFEAYTGAGTTTGNGSFDYTKIVAMTTRIMIYDILWIETGKLTAKDASGNETVLFDPATANQVTELTSIADINKGEWAFSNNPATFGQEIKSGSMTYNAKLSAEEFALYENKHFDFYKTANGGDPWLRTVDSTNTDQSYAGFVGYDGIAFELDTTGAVGKTIEGYIQLDIYLRIAPNNTDYKAFGNQVNAKFVAEDGTVIFNSEYGKGANWLPVGFKGTVYIPFSAFENGSTLVTSVEGFEDNVIRVGLIPVNQTWAVGDHVTLSNLRAYDCVDHADVNHNQVCDICTAEVPCTEHVDADHDQVCDYCGAEVPCTEHVDADTNCKCDYCDATLPCPGHADADHDQVCDYCGAEVPCTEHVDADTNCKCDYCDATLPCPGHADADHDQICDYCGAEVACTEHVDEDQDNLCDYCGASVGEPDSSSSAGENTSDKDSDLKSCSASVVTMPVALTLLAGAVYTIFKKRK